MSILNKGALSFSYEDVTVIYGWQTSCVHDDFINNWMCKLTTYQSNGGGKPNEHHRTSGVLIEMKMPGRENFDQF